jgi:hypothetical protein
MGAPGGPKTGGRQKGTQNKTIIARNEAMAKVNAALNELGENSLSGMKLLQEVIKSPDCPLDVRIQCSGLLLKHELPLEQAQQYVAIMPWPVKDLDEWKRKYMEVAPDADPNEAAEQIAKIALENEKDRKSPKDNAPWLDVGKEEIGF